MPDELIYLPARPGQVFFLATDIDGTFLGDEAGEHALRRFAAEFRGSFRLAYVTGRYESSVLKAIDEGFLPRPDFICSNVGTEINDLSDPHNHLGQKYHDLADPEWDLEAIYRLGVGEGIRRQDFPLQPPFQAGFEWDGKPESLEAFNARLGLQGSFKIFPSYGEYIDVLPNALGKGKAVQFLMEQMGLAHDQVVIAGDSGNDREMFQAGFQGIVPANALEELKGIAVEPWHYLSPLPAGRGVLDGLEHFGFVKKVMSNE